MKQRYKFIRKLFLLLWGALGRFSSWYFCCCRVLMGLQFVSAAGRRCRRATDHSLENWGSQGQENKRFTLEGSGNCHNAGTHVGGTPSLRDRNFEAIVSTRNLRNKRFSDARATGRGSGPKAARGAAWRMVTSKYCSEADWDKERGV